MRKSSFYLGIVFVVCSVLSVNDARADSHTYYNPNWASGYATAHYNTPYGSGNGQNPFHDYSSLSDGGNCTNFVSQAIIAGMDNTQTMSTIYTDRVNFDIDANGGVYRWYYRSDADRGPAFTSANKLHEYAVYNVPANKGLHFQYITSDTLTSFMNYQIVQYGDIIFADWDHNGTVDHSMIVTRFDWFQPGYNKIRVTYQGRPGVVGVTDIGLGDVNELYKYQAIFSVYRPVDYNPLGL